MTPVSQRGTNTSAVETGRPPSSGCLPAGARPVAQPAAAHQRGRAAAVEVERVSRAERRQQRGELLERQPRVVARAPVDRDREQPAVGDAQRRARVAAVGYVRVELAAPARKPSGSASRPNTGAPSQTSSGPACSRSPRGVGSELVAAARCRCRRRARARTRARVPGRAERDVAAGDARVRTSPSGIPPGRTKKPPTSASTRRAPRTTARAAPGRPAARRAARSARRRSWRRARSCARRRRARGGRCGRDPVARRASGSAVAKAMGSLVPLGMEQSVGEGGAFALTRAGSSRAVPSASGHRAAREHPVTDSYTVHAGFVAGPSRRHTALRRISRLIHAPGAWSQRPCTIRSTRERHDPPRRARPALPLDRLAGLASSACSARSACPSAPRRRRRSMRSPSGAGWTS